MWINEKRIEFDYRQRKHTNVSNHYEIHAMIFKIKFAQAFMSMIHAHQYVFLSEAHEFHKNRLSMKRDCDDTNY